MIASTYLARSSTVAALRGALLQWFAKRMRATIKVIPAQLHKRRHESVPVIGQWLSRLFKGYCNYYHVPGNTRRLDAFRRQVIDAWRHALKRRSQRHRMSR
jgi:RNA-directed DNA polymerase